MDGVETEIGATRGEVRVTADGKRGECGKEWRKRGGLDKESFWRVAFRHVDLRLSVATYLHQPNVQIIDMALKGILKNTEAGPSRPSKGAVKGTAKASVRARVAKADAPDSSAKDKPKKKRAVQIDAPVDSSDDNDFGDDDGDDEMADEMELDTDEEIERAQAGAGGEKKQPSESTPGRGGV